MSGHNKWSTIKRKKNAVDIKKNKIFTKLIKEISVAARIGGEDIDSNPKLRMAVNKAKMANVPKDNIEKTIKKVVGRNIENACFQVTYEAYASSGVALIIKCLTDNKNRIFVDIKKILAKNEGSFGVPGSVSYLFSLKGVIIYCKTKYKENEIIEFALALDNFDININFSESEIEVITSHKDFESVLSFFRTKFKEEIAEIIEVPYSKIFLNLEQSEKVLNLIDSLEELDDVQTVIHNLDTSCCMS